MTALDHARVQQHEAALTAYALRQLRAVPGIRLYGETDPERLEDRVAVISFNLDCVPARPGRGDSRLRGRRGRPQRLFLRAAVRRPSAGADAGRRRSPIRARQAGLDWPKPGMVRASFGLYNTFDEVDTLVEMLGRIARGEYRGVYESRANGAEYSPSPLVARAACP